MAKGDGEVRDGVTLTNLDQPLFDGSDATKRDLVDYLDAVAMDEQMQAERHQAARRSREHFRVRTESLAGALP